MKFPKINFNKNKAIDENTFNRKAILNETTSFAITEAYKTARTNIMFASAGEKGGKCILFTSATPGEGKTTTTINMASTFVQTGAKVILIDADMRKPRVHRYLKIERGVGLSDLLSGFITKEEAIHKDVKEGLDCITVGQIPPNPAELLSLEATGELINELKKEYDYVFIDTPPVTVVTDASVLSKYTAGIILVTRANYATFEGVNDAITRLQLAEAKILGFILNGTEIGGGRYGGYSKRYGGYGKKYGGYAKKYANNYGYGDKYENKEENKEEKEIAEVE